MDDSISVIEIIDDYSIIINYGYNDGAVVGERARIIAKGPDVINPITGENLGSFYAIKAVLTIDTVYEKFSVCKDIEVKKQNVLINPLSKFETTTKNVKPLNIESKSKTNKRPPDDNIIRVGDPVEILEHTID